MLPEASANIDDLLTGLAKQREDINARQQEIEANSHPWIKKANMFKACVDSKVVNPHSYVGQLFTKAHKAGTADGDAYHSIKSQAEKRYVRLRWVETKYKDFLSSALISS